MGWIMAAAHSTLTAAERKEQDALRKDWAEHGVLGDEPELDPRSRCEGLSANGLTAAAASAGRW
jgi:hypothetical protein